MAESTRPATPPIHLQHYYSISDASDKTIANCSVIPRHDAHFVTNLWVDGEYRQKGFGDALLARAVAEYGEQHPLYLTVAAYTDRAMDDAQLILWYQRFGFELTDFPGGMWRPAGKLVR